MAVKNTTQVLIGGKIMTLSGYESEEYLQKVAYYINNKMTELGQLPGYSRQSLETKHTLLDLNVADDYFKEQERADMLSGQKALLEKEAYSLKHELITMQMRMEAMEKEMQEEKARAEELVRKASETASDAERNRHRK